jgi:GT2 family glycosyltransferase
MEWDKDTVEYNKTVSIVIPNIDGQSLLAACLSSIDEPDITVEVILVDNGSTDSSKEYAQNTYGNVIIIANDKNEGFARACNQGAAKARGKYIVFLNNDVRLESHTLSTMVSMMQLYPTAGACQPTIVKQDGTFENGGSYLTATGFLYHLTESEVLSKANVSRRFALNGACLLVRHEAFVEAGGFDETFFAYFEETDLCWRMLRLGWNLLHIRSVKATHAVGATTQRIFSSDYVDFLSFRNRITTIRRNAEPNVRWRMLLLHVPICISLALLFVISGKPRNAKSIIRAILWHLSQPRLSKNLNGSQTLEKKELLNIRSLVVPAVRMGSVKCLLGYLKRWPDPGN